MDSKYELATATIKLGNTPRARRTSWKHWWVMHDARVAGYHKHREELRRQLQAARPRILSSICGVCPVQARFAFVGKCWYFRARFGDWRLACGDTMEAAVEANLDENRPGVYEGWDNSFGWMPECEVMREIVKCLRHWLGLRLTVPPNVVIDGREV